ncbi:MAG: hypothetical protein ACRCTK_04085, partial [Alphaproteobacteria bacterium]
KAAPHGRPNNADIDSDFFKVSIDLRQHIQENFGNLLEEQEINFSNQKRANISGSTNLKMLLAGLIFLSLLRTSEAAPQNRSCNADIDSVNFSNFLKVRVDSRQNIQGDFGSLGLSSACLYDLSQNITSPKDFETKFKTEAMQKAFDCIREKNLTTYERKNLISPTGKIYSFFTLEPILKFDPIERVFSAHFGRTYFNAEDYTKLAKRNFGILGIYNQSFTNFYLQFTNSSALLQKTVGNELGQTQDLGIMVMKGDCFAEDADTSFVPDIPSWYEFLNSDVAKITGIGIDGVAVGAIATVLLTKECKKKTPESQELSCKFENGVSPKATIDKSVSISKPVPAPMPKMWNCVVGGGQTRFSRLIESSSSESSEHDPHYLEMKSATKTAYPDYEEIKPEEVTRKLYDTPKSPAVPVRKEYANVKLEKNFLTGQTSAVTAN